MGRHSMAEPPPAPRRAVEESTTSTGTHRAVDGESRRGIAKWPIAVLAVLALLGTTATAMTWGINSLNNAAEAEAQGCSEGKRTLRVAVAPKLKEPMSAIATRWNSLDRPVRSHCITVEIGTSSWQDVHSASPAPRGTCPPRGSPNPPTRLSGCRSPIRSGSPPSPSR